jgi:hypothetical protein
MKRIVFIISIGLMGINLQADEINKEKSLQQNRVINLAGKQRMLTQKMTKEALLIAKGIEVEKNKKNLKATIALFDKTLLGLRNGDQELHLPKTENPIIIKEIDSAINRWKSFKTKISQIAKGKIDKKILKAIDQENLPLLANMNYIVEIYENHQNSDIDPYLAHTINLAGRERMLTQKMTKELLLIANSLKSDANVKSLRSSGELFQKTMNDLMTNNKESLNDPQIASRLITVQKLWSEYQNSIANIGTTSQEKAKAQKNQNKINQEMTKTLLEIASIMDTKAYKKQLKQTGELFDTTLNALINGDRKMGLLGTKDKRIKAQLIKVKKLWLDYKEIINTANVSDQALQKAISINMPLLREMNQAVKLYEQQFTLAKN